MLRLRSALGDGWIATRDEGYALARRGGAPVDGERFADAVTRARTARPADALGLLDRALASWRGRAFGDLADEHWCRPAAARLE